MNYIQITNLLKFIFLFLTFAHPISHAEIEIDSYKISYSWKNEWTLFIQEELKKDEYRIGPQAFLNLEIDQENLNDLQCDGYNSATLDQKSDFWVVFFSALVRAESGFNIKARSRMIKGHRSLGLLQLASQTAKSRCGIQLPITNILIPQNNLQCGIKLMVWQLLGAPISNNKKLRSDLEGKIFSKNMFQWGPLRQNDLRGRKLLIDWFLDHLGQLKFCHKL